MLGGEGVGGGDTRRGKEGKEEPGVLRGEGGAWGVRRGREGWGEGMGSLPKWGLSTCLSWSPALAAASISFTLFRTALNLWLHARTHATNLSTEGGGCSFLMTSIENTSLVAKRTSVSTSVLVLSRDKME